MITINFFYNKLAERIMLTFVFLFMEVIIVILCDKKNCVKLMFTRFLAKKVSALF